MATTQRGQTMTTKIQTRNGRTLSFDGAHYVMTGPTGTHSISAIETSIGRLAAHWSNFCNKPITVGALMAAVVKAFTVSAEDAYVSYDERGCAEYECTDFSIGGENYEADSYLHGNRDCLAQYSITKHVDRYGDVKSYVWSIEWNATSSSRGGLMSDTIGMESADYAAKTCRAMAAKGLLKHVLDCIESEGITLPQIVGAAP